jgi:hypothetical protein
MSTAPHSDIVVSVYHRIHRDGPSWANGGPGTEFSIACRKAADAAARRAYITADQHRDEDYDRHSK